MADYAHRGVVEGFYGTPFSHEDRLWLLERMGQWGLNRYVYAPKDDPLHRAEWRTPYPAESMAAFAELVATGRRAGVEVGFALSPGLSIAYSSPADVAALCEKLRDFTALGSRFLCLALDDVPTRLVHDADRRSLPGLAEAHVKLAHAVAEAVADDVTLWLVPTDYLGVEATEYLEEMGERLAPEIEVAWTGRTVVSPTIAADEAARRARTLRRKLLLWDNVPVTDGPMRVMLHLGPYQGRDPELSENASGVLLNPMQLPRASAVMLRSAAGWMRGDESPEDAWEAGLREVGRGAEEAFEAFARAHRFHCSDPSDRDRELEGAFEAVRQASRTGDGCARALARLRGVLERRMSVADVLRRDLSDLRLRSEIEPWIAAHHDETRRMEAAVTLLELLESDANRLAKSIALFAFQGKLTRIPTPPVASYGPRRVLYPQLVSMREEEAGLGADPALFRNLNLADEVVAFAEARAIRALGGRTEVGPVASDIDFGPVSDSHSLSDSRLDPDLR